jgi:hypothetical protein
MSDWAQLDPKSLRALAEWVAPNSAETAEDLWRVLLTNRARDSVPMGAASLLTKHHGRGEPGTLVTALLLCTCRRWESCTGALIKDVVDEGVLSEEELERLARFFLSGETIRFRKLTGQGTVQLQIQTPLRRWAAGHLLRRQPEGFASLLDQARSSKAPIAAAMVNGLLDSIAALGPDEAALLLDRGLVWPLGSVRRHALEILSAQGDVDEAVRLAASDPDAKVRRWRPRVPASATGNVSGDAGLQDTLFESPSPG